ncbi:MAG: nucleotidyl transferase AbiEii/AbiGii toxin family protein [Candidatus Daviesbacteria bacterium]|nr:nucleotidyl transferase AbiEii/AbiGii toxin family protein [Candidatus Daviesbacteria bacterium]
MHLEVLEKKNRQIFSLLKYFPGFYLAGGTALALQLGHRRSIDFNLFSSKKIPAYLIKEVEQVFVEWPVRILVNNNNELTVLVSDVKVTFLFYPFPILGKLNEFQKIKLLPAEEIAATKAYTIGRRGSFKDYIDLYFIIKNQVSNLEGIIEMAEKKYGENFNARLFLEQLVYLEDIKDTDIVFLKKPVTKNSISSFFIKNISQIKL